MRRLLLALAALAGLFASGCFSVQRSAPRPGLTHVGSKPVEVPGHLVGNVLVVEDKWLAALEAAIHGEMDRISQGLAKRVKELAERYEKTLPELTKNVEELEEKVKGHLERMGLSW